MQEPGVAPFLASARVLVVAGQRGSARKQGASGTAHEGPLVLRALKGVSRSRKAAMKATGRGHISMGGTAKEGEHYTGGFSAHTNNCSDQPRCR
jgi:hypothetical protein